MINGRIHCLLELITLKQGTELLLQIATPCYLAALEAQVIKAIQFSHCSLSDVNFF